MILEKGCYCKMIVFALKMYNLAFFDIRRFQENGVVGNRLKEGELAIFWVLFRVWLFWCSSIRLCLFGTCPFERLLCLLWDAL